MEKKIIRLPKPLPYQRKILDLLDKPEVKFVTFLKSRQSGGSFLNKLLVAKWGLENKRVRIGYVTPTLKLGKLFYKELGHSLTPYILKKNSQDLILEFASGSYVQFFSAESEDSIRGFQFDYLIVDEAAFMKTSFWDLVLRQTMLIKGRKCIFCSTPNLSNGFFHQNYYFGLDETMPQYGSVKINIYDNPFISDSDIEAIKKAVPDRVFRQEYMAEFLDDDGAVFRNYHKCIGKGELTGRYYAGIDWAKENDYTVCTIMNDKKQMVECYRITGLDYTVQVELIAKVLNKYKPIETISEQNNIGTVVNELLKKQYKGKLVTVTLNNTNKKDIIEKLIVAFEQGDIQILDYQPLIDELGWFSCEYNKQTQTIKYAAKGNLHDDTVISLAYAYEAINKIKNKWTI